MTSYQSRFLRMVGQHQARLRGLLVTDVGELARKLDIGPGDVLDALLPVADYFVWEGRVYDRHDIRLEISLQWRWDATGDVEVDLTPEQVRAFCDLLGIPTLEELK